MCGRDVRPAHFRASPAALGGGTPRTQPGWQHCYPSDSRSIRGRVYSAPGQRCAEIPATPRQNLQADADIKIVIHFWQILWFMFSGNYVFCITKNCWNHDDVTFVGVCTKKKTCYLTTGEQHLYSTSILGCLVTHFNFSNLAPSVWMLHLLTLR